MSAYIKDANYIGVAGITTAQETRALLAILDEIDPSGTRLGRRRISPGVLTSRKVLARETNRWVKRYPMRDELASCFVDDPRLLNIVHVAPGASPTTGRPAAGEATVADVLLDALWVAGPLCQGMQINACWPEPEAVARLRDAVGSTPFRIILQLGPRALEQCRKIPEVRRHEHNPEAFRDHFGLALRAATVPYVEMITDVLIDVSGGHGRPLDTALAEQAIVALQGLGLGIGVAGGLCAESVPGLAALRAKWPLSMDAEGKLRDESDSGGLLVLDKVKAYLDAAL